MLLRFWLECFRDGGVDLVEYGRQEAETLNKGLVPRVLWDLTPEAMKRVLILESFTYGPSPSDWKICTVYRDRKADIERQRISGAWMKDDDWYNEATDVGMIYSKQIDIDLQDMSAVRIEDDWSFDNHDSEPSDPGARWVGDKELIDDTDDDDVYGIPEW